MRFPFSRPIDPRIDSYVIATPRKLAGSTPLAEVSFIVLDTETTGFDVNNDRILSLSTLPVRAGRAPIGEMRSWLIYHANAHVTPATKIHTILPSESSLGLPIPDILTEVTRIIAGSVIVGHHIQFDALMIDAAMRPIFGSGIRNPLIDTAVMAMQSVEAFRKSGYANQKPPGLDELCAHLGLPSWERHTADGDTFITAQLFLLLCARIRQKLGRELTLGDLPVTRSPA